MLAIDHVIVTVADPASWARQLRERTGLAAVPGGRHEGLGTGNWIVPLGDVYVELMTIADHDEAKASPLGRWVIEQISGGDRLAALCLRTDEIDDVGDRTGHRPQAMSRHADDGTALHWRLVGLDAAMSDERLPYFIQWDIAVGQHPGAMSVEHRVRPSGIFVDPGSPNQAADGLRRSSIAWIEYGGDANRLSSWLGDHALPIRCVDEPPGPRRVAIATDEGHVVITTTGIA